MVSVVCLLLRSFFFPTRSSSATVSTTLSSVVCFLFRGALFFLPFGSVVVVVDCAVSVVSFAWCDVLLLRLLNPPSLPQLLFYRIGFVSILLRLFLCVFCIGVLFFYLFFLFCCLFICLVSVVGIFPPWHFLCRAILRFFCYSLPAGGFFLRLVLSLLFPTFCYVVSAYLVGISMCCFLQLLFPGKQFSLFLHPLGLLLFCSGCLTVASLLFPTWFFGCLPFSPTVLFCFLLPYPSSGMLKRQFRNPLILSACFVFAVVFFVIGLVSSGFGCSLRQFRVWAAVFCVAVSSPCCSVRFPCCCCFCCSSMASLFRPISSSSPSCRSSSGIRLGSVVSRLSTFVFVWFLLLFPLALC